MHVDQCPYEEDLKNIFECCNPKDIEISLRDLLPTPVYSQSCR